MNRKSNPESKGETGGRKPAKEKLADKTRESMNILLLMAEFAESAIGQECLATYGLNPENIESICNDDSILYPIAALLGAIDEPDMIEGAVPFFRLLAIKNPKFYQECLGDSNFNDELRKRLKAIN